VIDLFENGTFTTHTFKLMEVPEKDALKDPDFFEGGDRYHSRDRN